MSIYSVKIALFVQHFGKVNCLHCIVPFIWMHPTKWPSSLHDEPYQDDGWPWFTPGDGDMEQFAILGCKAENLMVSDISLTARGAMGAPCGDCPPCDFFAGYVGSLPPRRPS